MTARLHELRGNMNSRLKRLAHAADPLGVSRLERFLVSVNFERLARTLERSGLTPATVFDIGVAYGTPWLYAAFPEAKFHLIDPTRESLPYMTKAAKKIDADVHNVALGHHNEKQKMTIRPEIGTSSLFKDVGISDEIDSYDVDVVRFDSLFDDFPSPSLCKIDVQGAELMVLRGMGDHLKKIDVFIVETSLICTLEGEAPEIADIIRFMSENGFVIYDISGMTRRPLDSALAQVDAVFVREDSPLRTDRRWG